MKYDSMNECFANMKSQIEYAYNNSDLHSIFNALDSIKGATIVTGLGGSAITATFLAKILREKNGLISTFITPRDLVYMNLDGYENVIAVSYSGSNLGVKLSFDNSLNHYLFTGNRQDNAINMIYSMLLERSYVSINATVVPLSILMMYYCNDRKLIEEIISCDMKTETENSQYEVLTGYETAAASTMLESCIIESGIGTCILHDKYNYCHGRINITRNSSSDLIIFDSDDELDTLLIEELRKHYGRMIIIEQKYDDHVINDFYASIMALKLVHHIAENRKIDISDMDELENNDILYRYNGSVR